MINSPTPTSSEEISFAVGKVVNKKWVIQDTLGEGCCGIVLKVNDITNSKRKAAMKV